MKSGSMSGGIRGRCLGEALLAFHSKFRENPHCRANGVGNQANALGRIEYTLCAGDIFGGAHHQFPREFPRLCREGSRSLTLPGVQVFRGLVAGNSNRIPHPARAGG